MLERWTRAVVRYRAVVVAGWLVVVVLGLTSSSGLNNLLSTSLAVPGTDSATADQILSAHFGQNVEGTFTVVLSFKNASPSQLSGFESRINAAAHAVPSGYVIEKKAVAGVLYENVATSLNLVHASAETPVLRQALERQGLTRALVTGPPALNYDLSPVLRGDLRTGELVALLLALVLLVSVLGACWALAVPFVVAGATVSGAVAVAFVLAHHFLMVLYIPNVIELIGLGLAIDYSLLIVHRFRAEVLVPNVSVPDAVVATMNTAGRTIALSSGTVAIGLSTLLLIPVPFMRSLGAAGLVVPIVALVSALTLQPALLSYLGRRGVRPAGVRGLMAGRDVLGGAWAKVARFVVRRPVVVMSLSLTLLVVLATSALWLQLTPGSVSAVPQSLPSARALSEVSARVGPALITPNEVVIDLGVAGRANTPSMTAARLHLAEAILHDPRVFAVAIDTKAPFVDPSGRYEQIFVFGRAEFGAVASQQLVGDLRTTYLASSGFPAGTRLFLGGAPAQGVDFLHTVYGAFVWIVALALALAFLVLAWAFRSPVLALLAVLLDLASVGVVYGLLVLVFRFGVGSSILGTYHVSQIEGWVPVFLFAMLFGLSMDYEVFIVSRMREARDRGLDNEESIVEGLERTGGVVSAAAVILMGALAGLVFGHVAGLQELGVGLALGVLLDATIVRGLLLPSAMAMLGPWNWWLPAPFAKLVHAQAAPLDDRGGRP